MKTPIANGIDVSKHNGNINWKAVRTAGYDHVVIRAGYGANNTDQRFITNALAAVNLRLTAGIYWFSYALNREMAAQEGMYAVQHAKKYWNRCLIAYDAEYDTRNRAAKVGVVLGKKELTAMADDFLTVVVQHGYIPCLYTNNDYTKNFFDVPYLKSKFKDLYIWYARYGKEDDNIYSLPADMWQYSSSGVISGINGRVDLNRIYKDFDVATPSPVTPVRPVTPNHYIKFFQQCWNLDHPTSTPLVDDGIDGPKTKAARKSLLLRKGSKGNLVKWLQTALQFRGYYSGQIDSDFGDKTYAGVRRFQEDNALEVDGIAGNNTITSLFYN